MERGDDYMDKALRTIYVGRIPPECNEMKLIIDHFSQYGHIDSIWVGKTKATIEFQTKESAAIAIESPRPFCNNRFVKVTYHLYPEKSEANLIKASNIQLIREQNKKVCEEIEINKQETEMLREDMIRQTSKKNAPSSNEHEERINSRAHETEEQFEKKNNAEKSK
ncbi:zinc finger CCCH domain-containing protein 41-like [Histomonas meleagridis]|uniref:zinc finger CCCH domain-containing protein 41-like n=1 Tax=Histomonas meleagridis TaxID=135588 RepID=UPI00355A5618|nr:zinc finger CCCH domain-containing protein 41-like [Histomonas meleagridis]KAH0797170.1 zinc finger CCCH domain-containing protein 41-like [Histomonas meleagridis]